MADQVTLRIARKISEVQKADWDRLVAGASPFLKWDWLDSMEQAGCVNQETGWLPHHIVVEKSGALVGACPMYLKLHSMGEFVFDYEWLKPRTTPVFNIIQRCSSACRLRLSPAIAF